MTNDAPLCYLFSHRHGRNQHGGNHSYCTCLLCDSPGLEESKHLTKSRHQQVNWEVSAAQSRWAESVRLGLGQLWASWLRPWEYGRDPSSAGAHVVSHSSSRRRVLPHAHTRLSYLLGCRSRHYASTSPPFAVCPPLYLLHCLPPNIQERKKLQCQQNSLVFLSSILSERH